MDFQALGQVGEVSLKEMSEHQLISGGAKKIITWLPELGVNIILVDFGKLRIKVVDSTAVFDFWGRENSVNFFIHNKITWRSIFDQNLTFGGVYSSSLSSSATTSLVLLA